MGLTTRHYSSTVATVFCHISTFTLIANLTTNATAPATVKITINFTIMGFLSLFLLLTDCVD